MLEVLKNQIVLRRYWVRVISIFNGELILSKNIGHVHIRQKEHFKFGFTNP